MVMDGAMRGEGDESHRLTCFVWSLPKAASECEWSVQPMKSLMVRASVLSSFTHCTDKDEILRVDKPHSSFWSKFWHCPLVLSWRNVHGDCVTCWSWQMGAGERLAKSVGVVSCKAGREEISKR